MGVMNYHLKEEQLLTAIERGQLNKVKQLVSSGIHLNTVLHSKARSESATILGTAAYEGQLHIVRYLILCNVGLNYQDPCLSRNALHWACMGGHYEVVHMLVIHGIDVNCQDRDNVTPLIRAAIIGSAEIVEVLIAHGADVNQCDRLHSSALHYGSFHGKQAVVSLIVRAGCIHNQPAIFGQGTPLANLFYQGDSENCRLLIEAGYSLSKDTWIAEYSSLTEGNSDRQRLLQYLVQEYKCPPSLTRCCRYVIRRRFQGMYTSHKIYSLPLPSKLLRYLQLDDS